jgi:hypothetical protein
VREIQAFLAEMYAAEVSPDFISTVTEAVHAEVTAWQARPLERMYPVVFFDALRVKIRDEATVRELSRDHVADVLVHRLRHSLDFANWKERKPLAAALRPIYTAASADARARSVSRRRKVSRCDCNAADGFNCRSDQWIEPSWIADRRLQCFLAARTRSRGRMHTRRHDHLGDSERRRGLHVRAAVDWLDGRARLRVHCESD